MTIDSKDEHFDNQIWLFLSNLFYRSLCNYITLSLTILDWVLFVLQIPYLFIRQFMVITQIIFEKLSKLLNCIKLCSELLLNVFETLISLPFSSREAERHYRKNSHVYLKMKENLFQLNILPLSPSDGITCFLMFQKVPSFVWKYVLPYPKFFYEDTFSNVTISKNKIAVTLPKTVPVMTMIKEDEICECSVLSLPAREYFLAIECARKRGQTSKKKVAKKRE